MIGYTNSTASKPMPGEYINVRLLTNQSSHSDLNEIAFTVEYEGYSKDYVWEGSEVTVLIPADMEYTVKFKDVEGYKTPENVTYTAEAENARDIEALYQTELLTVNVSADEGEVSGFEVKISEYKVLSEALLDGYTPLEYIESTGSQYIDTGFKPNQDTRVLVDFQMTSSDTGQFVYGARNSSYIQTFGLLISGTSNTFKAVYGSNNNVTIDIPFLERYISDQNKNICSIGDKTTDLGTETFSSDYNLYLFAGNRANTVESYAKMKLYSCQIYDNGTLIRDFVPVKRSDDVVGLYDKANETFYASVNSTGFVAGPKSAYIQLEYIECAANQYIDTGIYPNQDTKVEVKFQSTKTTGSCVICGETAWRDNTFGIWTHACGYGVDGNTAQVLYGDTPVTATLDKNILYKDGAVAYTMSEQTFSTSYTMYLGAGNKADRAIEKFTGKIYHCKIYDNGTLVRDFVPVKSADGMVGLYDKVNEVFYTSAGTTAFVAGEELTETIATQTTASATHKIPFGVSYTVSASSVDGFTAPASQSFTANQSVRNLSMVYEEIKSGVFIQGVSGKLYTESEWNNQETPNGVAVLTENCRFVMALANAHTDDCLWGSDGTLVSGITTATLGSDAQADYDGEAQTTTILNQLGNSSSTNDAPAAYYCRAYTFPNGKKGYLGAAGEWQVALDNKAAVESALAKCGGTAMNNYYWTSTQYSTYTCWFVLWGSEYLDHNSKNISRLVRAFTAI